MTTVWWIIGAWIILALISTPLLIWIIRHRLHVRQPMPIIPWQHALHRKLWREQMRAERARRRAGR